MALNLGIGSATFAAGLPSGFAETRLASGLDVTGMEFAPDGRLFITEKAGRVRIIRNGSLLSTPFLTINVNNDNERGLQSIVFDPNFASNHYVYLYYTTATTPIHNRVSRFTANGDGTVAGSEKILLELNNLNAGNHNGGALFFKDGKLFITTGDNKISSNAQSKNTLLGKVLRINPDGSIPTDNPFYTSASGNNRAIWALGLRNPFRAVVQPGTGRIFINDVGADIWEEINEAAAGRNFGWPDIEGKRTTQIAPANYQDPLYAYNHSAGCSITDGTFYNPTVVQFPASYVGKYFFADYCGGYLKTLDLTTHAVATFATGISQALGVKVGPDGSLYYLARGASNTNTFSVNGEVWRVQYTASNAPSISAQPVSKTVEVGQTVTFAVGASGAGLSYQWQRNGINIPGATSASYTTSATSLTDNGAVFQVIVKNALGLVVSNGAKLAVSSNHTPTASITSPANGTVYRAGNVIHFTGIGHDPEDGTLPATAYEWEVLFYHDTHNHPGPEPTVSADGRSGSFEIPTEGETSANVWYRLFLKVKDSRGATYTTSVDVRPRVVTISLASNPAGLSLILDDHAQASPYARKCVAGMLMNLSAPVSQTLNGSAYGFSNWSSGGKTGGIIVPDSDVTYTATFNRLPENPTGTVAGLDYQYYEGAWTSLPDFNLLTAKKTGIATNFDLSSRVQEDFFGFRFKGYLNVPADGAYTFYTSSDDGSQLYIGNALVVNNDGLHANTEKQGTIHLKAGRHACTVIFFESDRGQSLKVSYAGPGIEKQLVPASALWRTGNRNARLSDKEGILEAIVRVYPVPATGVLTVEADAALEGIILLRDLQGQTIKTFPVSDPTEPVQLLVDDVETGLYVLTVTVAGKPITQKVLIQH